MLLNVSLNILTSVSKFFKLFIIKESNKIMKERYIRNLGAMTEEESNSLQSKRVCVVGCGGLGGGIIEQLARLGIGFITAVDGDVFDISNLNRQVLSTQNNIGINKAAAAKQRISEINSEVTVNSITQLLTEENAVEFLSGHDIVIDALDNKETRFILQNTCNKLKIPLIHGSAAGWCGQICTILPGDNSLDKIYPNKSNPIDPKNTRWANSYIVSIITGLQVSEAVKLLIGKGDVLHNKILFVNTKNNSYNIINL